MSLPEGSIDSGCVSGVGIGVSTGVGAPPPADLFRILEQASDAASIRIDPFPAVAAGGHRGVSSPSSLTLANTGLPIGIADPAANLVVSALKGKNGIAPPSAPQLPAGDRKLGGNAGSSTAQNGKKRRGWRKPEGRPSRPLSAYNLFFQAERGAMVNKKNGGANSDIKSESEGNSLSREEKKCDDARPAKRRRRRGPPTGIGFATMAQTIGAKWKTLDGLTKTIFESKAAVDRERYEKEMAVWKKTDDFKKYEAERKRNARNRGKGGVLNGSTEENRVENSGESKPLPVPLPPVTGAEEDSLTPLQRLFQVGGSGCNDSCGSGAPPIVSPEMLTVHGMPGGQCSGATNASLQAQQQYLGPMKYLQAQQQAQGHGQPGDGSQMPALLNGVGGAEALRMHQQQLQLQPTGNSSLEQLSLGQQLQPLHQVSPDVAAKEQALLAQQQRQLQLIQQQELQAKGHGFAQANVSSLMQQVPPPLQAQQDQFLQLLQQQCSYQGQIPNHPEAQINEEDMLHDDLLQQMRRESLTGATTQASAGPDTTGQRGSLGLGSLLPAACEGASLGLDGIGTGTGKRDSLGLGSLFSPSGIGQRGSLGLGSVAGLATPSTAPASASEHTFSQQTPAPLQPAIQGDGRLSLQQMLQLQKLKRQREAAAAPQEQQRQSNDGAWAAPTPSTHPSSLELHKLQQEFQLQQQQLHQLQQQQLLLQNQGGGLPGIGAVEAGNGHNPLLQGGATQGLAGGAAAQPPYSQQQQLHHQDEDLAMFANMFHQEQQHQQQKQDSSGIEPTAV